MTAAAVTRGSELRVDGTQPVSTSMIEAMRALCDRAEDGLVAGLVRIHVGGVPGEGWTRELSIDQVSKWERALRRLERLAIPTVAVVSGDCGGIALDTLLATDFRIATPDARLVVAVDSAATWPGMSLYRLAQLAGVGGIRRAALLGMPIGASEALSLRLVDEVVDDPGPALDALAESAAVLTGKEFAIRRQLIFDASRMSFMDALGTHLAACDRALRLRTDS